MPTITLKTQVKAHPKLVFDLSRSIDLHKISTSKTKEEAIAGRTSGLIELDETVTWRATHLGIRQKLTSKITEYDFPHSFADEMVKGAFKRFKHSHTFEETHEGTIVTDIFDYDSPFGLLGKIVDALFLERYMTRFLEERNNVIKQFAESERWKEVPGMREEEFYGCL